MADDFQLGSGSWWDSSRNRFDGGGTTPSPSISTTLNSIASFGWPTEMVDMKNRSSMDSATASTGGSMVLQGGHDETSAAASNMQMMGLGLSSQMEWNQAFLGEKSESSFRSLLQEDFPPEPASQDHWRQKLYSGSGSGSSEMNRGFSLDQPQFSPQASSNDSTITSQNLATAFQVDPAAAYGMLLPENQQQQHYRPVMNYPYPPGGYAPELVNKYPQFLKTSPPKQAAASSNQLHFTNNTPFWNASAPPAAMGDTQASFFPALQTQIPAAPFFDDKRPKNKVEARDMGVPTKKNTSEASNKRPRNETPPPLPAFKVRKEKMGDRITALQQLVSPFGKTDTASVLSEAIEYIKFLHEQVGALSAPYMKNGAPIQNQQKSDKSKDGDGSRQDLRSRGLCLVPVSSTFPVTHETAVDFWTPTFGGTFR
ncbi:hypothetical protein ACS0TY_017331 [Phlomoides rotata]